MVDPQAELALRGPEQPTLAVIETALTVDQIVGHSNLIHEVASRVMRDGEHYGMIPGAGTKKTLLKPGAEKLLLTFRIAVRPDVEDLSTQDMIRYRVRANAIAQETGKFLGAGVGECSTAEEKYSWRGIKAAGEWDATPEVNRRIKWSMNGRNEVQARQVRTNPFDYANTVLKMAKKRAIIDMCLTVLAASDIFAQDLEDLPGTPGATAGDAPAPAAAPSVVHAPASVVNAKVVEMISDEKRNEILCTLGDLGVGEAAFVAQVLVPKGIHSLSDLTRSQAVSITTMLQEKLQAQTATA